MYVAPNVKNAKELKNCEKTILAVFVVGRLIYAGAVRIKLKQ